ncbi:hypothetical protein LTR50_006583 [Elasticomyces elasticus]|nr:hypothetical protein LTR50_006583 [Elasticomyces elasticus]
MVETALTRFAAAFRSKPSASRTRLTKRSLSVPNGEATRRDEQNASQGSNGVQAREARSKSTTSGIALNTQTGERRDDTEMLHSLVHRDSADSVSQSQWEADLPRRPGEFVITSLSPQLWKQAATYMTPSGIASLAFSCKAFHSLLGSEALNDLNAPENHQYKIEFLVPMDGFLPDHLLCFPCAKYHLRTRRGQELRPPPRIRLTPGRTLPFAFVQLALRAQRYSPDYGIQLMSLSRRWNCRDSSWLHHTQYTIHHGHLLLRVVSTCHAAPGLTQAGERHLLYSREDYTPYFSVCAHWKDGELMNLCKCALRHIPKRKIKIGQRPRDLAQVPALVTLCNECRPMRRCPECPTEYLIELRLVEDKNDSFDKFKQAIIVTRWSDLGDGTSPSSPEWAACNGEGDFDSFAAVGNRAISAIFESHFSDNLSIQRVVSLNPKKEKRGEAGHNWY